MKRFIVFGFCAVLLLNLFDIYSTIEILQQTVRTESNPVGRMFMDYLGLVPGMLFHKFMFLSVLWYLCFKVVKEEMKSHYTKLIAVGEFIIVSVYTYFMYFHNFQYLTML